VLYYTCPMPEHSSVHEDKPGKCPICGMTLIPVMAAPGATTNSAPSNADSPIHQSTNPQTQNAITNPVPSNTNSFSNTKPAAKQLYFCPMHPEVISEEPGKCPKCGMDLVPMNVETK
jgi:rubrerythrin